MFGQPTPRRQFLRQFLLLILLLAGAAWVVEMRREGDERDRYPAPGLILVQGQRRIHIDCEGAVQAGMPAVLLEAGTGESHLAWAAVQAALAPHTRVCSYDRPGYGWSDRAPGPRTATAMAEELHDVLPQAGVTAPYVLVGQGLGSVVSQRYAQLYPEQVVGLVLVAPPDTSALVVQPEPVRAAMVQVERLPEAVARVLAPFGGMRWLIRAGAIGDYGKLPDEVRAPARALAYRSQTWRTALAEMGAMGTNALALVEEAEGLPPVPVTVIVPAEERSPLFVREMTVVEAPVADEDLHIVRPGLVVEAVREMMGNRE